MKKRTQLSLALVAITVVALLGRTPVQAGPFCNGDDLHVTSDRALVDDRPYCTVTVDRGATLHLAGHTLTTTWLELDGMVTR